MKSVQKFKVVVSLFFVLTLLALPAMATTTWSQLWDSTPTFNSTYNALQVELGGSGLGIFGAAMSGFTTGTPVVSSLVSPYLAVATSASGWDGNLGTNGNLFRLNFGSALSTSFDAQVRYLFNGQVVSVNSWHYDGTGLKNDPVNSWSSINNNNFKSAPVPEPASLLLLGSGLGMIGLAAWRRKK
jgi:hypothetical protein